VRIFASEKAIRSFYYLLALAFSTLCKETCKHSEKYNRGIRLAPIRFLLNPNLHIIIRKIGVGLIYLLFIRGFARPLYKINYSQARATLLIKN
jgi:hypothetical protein